MIETSSSFSRRILEGRGVERNLCKKCVERKGLRDDREKNGCSRKFHGIFFTFRSKLLFSRSFVTIDEISHFRVHRATAFSLQANNTVGETQQWHS